MKVKVDRIKCQGNGLCEMAAPTVYQVGGDGLAELLTDEPSADEVPAVEEAIAYCPTGALSIEE